MFSGQLKLSDDDDDYFNESSSNNLANLFNVNLASSQEEDENTNKTLKYTPRKINDKKEDKKENNGSNDWNVVIAKVVTAYKLVNKDNISQGKIGMALLRNSEQNLRIVLYKTKANILSNTNISPNLKLFFKNNYIQFQDEDFVFWSLMFESIDVEIFLNEVRSKCIVEDQNIDTKLDEKSNPEETKVIIEQNNQNTTVELDSTENTGQDTKANILTRMAKMGKAIPMIPKFNSTSEITSDSSDSENKPIIASKPIVHIRKHNHNAKSNLYTPDSTNNSSLIPYTTTTMLMPQSQNMLLNNDNEMKNFISENRIQNSEQRMNLIKLDNKIDKVLDRLEVMNLNGISNARLDKDDEIITLEEKVLELKKENRNLKVTIKQSNNDIVNEKLVQSESLICELQNELDKTKNKILEQETFIKNLQDNINISKTDFEIKINEDIQKINELKISLDKQNETNLNNEKYCDQLKEKNCLLTENVETLQNENVLLNKTINDCNIKIAEVQSQIIPNQQQSDQMENIESVVKNILSNLYNKVCDEFSEPRSFSQDEIVRILRKAIKYETNEGLKIIKK